MQERRGLRPLGGLDQQPWQVRGPSPPHSLGLSCFFHQGQKWIRITCGEICQNTLAQVQQNPEDSDLGRGPRCVFEGE